ncbi:DUF2163 domain-containing protein [Sphingomonas morindae]|uniref:DUF2163 domain-containing protein n=1 Tax=Sphingomonas morindae TaxID=1541170 RepID=A0ABY4X3R3_9SPHN|nr:DUF2163 domain-containing protein [Sphingomonas morindae]USI71477.1 DUF2163 domain-containing protein [Sphingomonas morindae]
MSGPVVEAALTTLALGWRLDRRDGVTLGFTSHDRDLTVAGLRYRARPGMLPSALRQGDGFQVATLDVAGTLSDAAIRAADLDAGRWDGALCRLYLIDWAAPEAGLLLLARGELGDVTRRDSGFTAELRGATALLERPVVERTSAECRADLGDRRCRIDLAPRTRVARLVAIDEAGLTADTAEPVPNAYGFGRLRWLDGANAGLWCAVAASSGTRLTLRAAPRAPAVAGERLLLVEGCDRTFATCRARFGNAANFRGEPHLPGHDLLARYGTR